MSQEQEHSYMCRERKIVVYELLDIYAARRVSAPPLNDSYLDSGPRLLLDFVSRSAFESSGWRFFAASTYPISMIAADASTRVARVYRRPSGAFLLQAGRATVLFQADAEEKVVLGAIVNVGARVVDRLFTIAPNMFTIEFPLQCDFFPSMERLAASEICKFAEPEFEEMIGGRSGDGSEDGR